jgi:hypothetical protein
MPLADVLIVACAVFDLIFLILLALAGLRFRALATQSSQRLRPVIQRGRGLAVTGQRVAAIVESHSSHMLAITKTLASDLHAKLETTRRIVTEVVHPSGVSMDKVAQTVEQGQAWTARLSRLGAAARRAAGQDGGRRRRA